MCIRDRCHTSGFGNNCVWFTCIFLVTRLRIFLLDTQTQLNKKETQNNTYSSISPVFISEHGGHMGSQHVSTQLKDYKTKCKKMKRAKSKESLCYVETHFSPMPSSNCHIMRQVSITCQKTAQISGIGKYLSVLSCLLYTSPSPRDRQKSRMPSSA